MRIISLPSQKILTKRFLADRVTLALFCVDLSSPVVVNSCFVISRVYSKKYKNLFFTTEIAESP